jgi:hypothetical protein
MFGAMRVKTFWKLEIDRVASKVQIDESNGPKCSFSDDL